MQAKWLTLSSAATTCFGGRIPISASIPVNDQ